MAGLQSIDTKSASSAERNREQHGRAPNLSEVIAGKASLRLGMSGPGVEQLHRQLAAAGHPISEGDPFGPKTLDAVKTLQRSRGLEANGVVDQHTLEAFESSYERARKAPVSLTAPAAPPAPAVSQGTFAGARELQEFAQRRLTELGATHPAAARLQELKAVADRAVAGQPLSDADTRGLAQLARARQLEAIDALDRPVSGIRARPGDRTAPTTLRPDPFRDEARERVHRKIAKRMGKDWDKLSPAERAKIKQVADRMAKILSNNKDLSAGYEVLDRVLTKGRINVGLAGIRDPAGGDRSPEQIDDTKKNMSVIAGQEVDAVIDNTNGGPEAVRAAVCEEQARQLRELAQFMNQVGVRVDVTCHSNGFNALARVCRDSSPPVRLGNVMLINPNVPTKHANVVRDMKAIVARSERVSLITSVSDGAVAITGAGVFGGPAWKKQIEAALAAGVKDVRVYSKPGHNLDDMAEWKDKEPPDLDFYFNERTGRMEPRDPYAWQKITGYRWDPAKGQFVYDPLRRPKLGPRDHENVRAA